MFKFQREKRKKENISVAADMHKLYLLSISSLYYAVL